MPTNKIATSLVMDDDVRVIVDAWRDVIGRKTNRKPAPSEVICWMIRHFNSYGSGKRDDLLMAFAARVNAETDEDAPEGTVKALAEALSRAQQEQDRGVTIGGIANEPGAPADPPFTHLAIKTINLYELFDLMRHCAFLNTSRAPKARYQTTGRPPGRPRKHFK